MIAVESFKKFRIIDLVIILTLAAIWSLLTLIINKAFDPQYSYILSLLLVTFSMSFIAYLVRKAGSATIFYILCGLFTYNINNFGVVGANKLIIFVISGVVFELFFLIFKLEVKNIQIDVIIGTAISAAVIPVTIVFLLSFDLALSMVQSLVNLILLSFLVGLLGAVISFIIWYNLKTSKLVLKYEYRH